MSLIIIFYFRLTLQLRLKPNIHSTTNFNFIATVYNIIIIVINLITIIIFILTNHNLNDDPKETL